MRDRDSELLARAVSVAADVAARVTAEFLGAAADQDTAPCVLRQQGEYWLVRYDGQETHLRDSRGLHYLARLLAQPGTPVHALALSSGTQNDPGGGYGCETVALDAQARAAYRGRLTALDAEVDAAGEDHDLARLEQLTHERAFLLDELARSLGLHGRGRLVGSPVERARVAVTKRIRSAIANIGAHHVSLGRHLSTSVRTGTWCCYTSQTTWISEADAGSHRGSRTGGEQVAVCATSGAGE